MQGRDTTKTVQETLGCPKCGAKGSDLIKAGFRVLSGGVKVQAYQCKGCGYVAIMTKYEK